MKELANGCQFFIAFNFFLEEILDRLDVVVGGALDVLDALGILFAELLDDVVEHALGMAAECRNLRYPFVGRQCLQPAHLYQNTVMDQAEFAEYRPQ